MWDYQKKFCRLRRLWNGSSGRKELSDGLAIKTSCWKEVAKSFVLICWSLLNLVTVLLCTKLSEMKLWERILLSFFNNFTPELEMIGGCCSSVHPLVHLSVSFSRRYIFHSLTFKPLGLHIRSKILYVPPNNSDNDAQTYGSSSRSNLFRKLPPKATFRKL